MRLKYAARAGYVAVGGQGVYAVPEGCGVGQGVQHLLSRVEHVAADPLHKNLAPRARDLMAHCPQPVSSIVTVTGHC